MKTILKGAAVFIIAALAACSNIAEDERLIYIEPLVTSDRKVLIEDFTGQNCTNCPKATDAIHEIQEAYGDNVVPVAIHCGVFGYKGTAKAIGLMTDVGSEYWNRWFSSTQGQPVAKINRNEATESYGNWAADVLSELQKSTDVSLSLQTLYDPDQRRVTIHISAIAPKGKKAKLQVWLTEDNIVAMQKLPDGSRNTEYVHNHVLRDAINGPWGEEIVFGESELQKEYTYTLPEGFGAEGTLASACVPKECSVVAFVYDDSSVLQAEKAKVTAEE